jgi:undecaprenyl diphosphate synthase
MSTTSPAPRHIAVVMDGNGRWAAKRGRPRSLGHQAGLKALRKIVEHVGQLGIAELTVFAFSSENWKRPKHEVSRLMDLFMRALDKETRALHENGVKLRFIGDLTAFNPTLQKSISSAVERTRDNQQMILNVAVNYGGRWDIVQAAQTLAKACEQGRMHAEDINEAAFAEHLMLAEGSEPDLLIRTGGEMRISNFLLWQFAYTELYFSAELWPDFTPECLDAAIAEFVSRERRFGRTGDQVQSQAR